MRLEQICSSIFEVLKFIFKTEFLC